MNARWGTRPDGSNWGDFGADDQVGRLNLLTPERVRRAVAEVREGRVFCLSMPLDYPGGNYHDLGRKPPRLHPVVRGGRAKYNNRGTENHPDVSCDDWVELYTQSSTQWDALCHIGSAFDADGDGVAEQVYYNGYRGGEHIPDPPTPGSDAPFTGARALGIENMAATGVQGRGVMVDLYSTYGRPRAIVGYDDLMRIMEADGVEVEEGDMLCLYTGQADAILEMNRDPDRETLEDAFSHLDGCDDRLLRWIDDSGVVAIAADNFSVEAVPPSTSVPGQGFERIHQLCIFKLGIHLGELWHLGPLNDWLKEHGRYRFLLTAPPLRLPGAAGSPVTPVATV